METSKAGEVSMQTSKVGEIAMQSSKTVAAPVAPRVWRVLTLGDRLDRRTAVVAWSAAGIGLGLFFGWNWVVAAGLSSIVLGRLPCAARCAAGVGTGGDGGRRERGGDREAFNHERKRESGEVRSV